MLASIQLAATGAMIAALIFIYVRQKKRLKDLERSIQLLRGVVWDAHFLARMLPDCTVPPRLSDWAACPDLLAHLAMLIKREKPKLVVELGSGLSTFVISSALMRNGCGRLISIDHSTEWAENTRQSLLSTGLESWVSVIEAPLVREMGGSEWYQTTALNDLRNIDLLLIDGPPAKEDPLVRAPALSYFWDRLAVNGIIVLDDAARDGEQAMVEQWIKNSPNAELQWHPFERGCCVIRKKGLE